MVTKNMEKSKKEKGELNSNERLEVRAGGSKSCSLTYRLIKPSLYLDVVCFKNHTN